MNFFKFLSKRLASIAVSLAAVVAITFYLMHAAPGNFLEMQQVREAMAALDSKGREAQRQYEVEFQKRYALDKPVHVQIGIFLKNAATFKFGPSFINPNVPIEPDERIPAGITASWACPCWVRSSLPSWWRWD